MSAVPASQTRAALLRLQSGARIRIQVAGASRLVRLHEVSPEGLRVVERGATRAPRLLPWDAIERVDCRLHASAKVRLVTALAGALLLGFFGWIWERQSPAGSHRLPTGTLLVGGALLGAAAGGTRRRWELMYERAASSE